ncbi:SIMPL domain-containing protein [Bacteroidota bacterium]
MYSKLIPRAILFLLLFTGLIAAQESDKSTVFITTSSVTQIPADNIYFSITLSVQKEDAKKAYDDHKTMEKNLLNIFYEFEISDSNISYSLLHIRRTPPYSKEKLSYNTRQLVSAKISDFSKYEPLQLALLSNGIYEYNAKFSSEGNDEWIDRGLQKAIIKATKEAEMTAKNSGKRLGEILEIESRHSYSSNSDGRMLSTSGVVRGESLIKLPQFVPMRVSLRVRFELLEKE